MDTLSVDAYYFASRFGGANYFGLVGRFDSTVVGDQVVNENIYRRCSVTCARWVMDLMAVAVAATLPMYFISDDMPV